MLTGSSRWDAVPPGNWHFPGDEATKYKMAAHIAKMVNYVHYMSSLKEMVCGTKTWTAEDFTVPERDCPDPAENFHEETMMKALIARRKNFKIQMNTYLENTFKVSTAIPIERNASSLES